MLLPFSSPPESLFWSAPPAADTDFTAEDPLALDYLGFGLPPGTPSWGALLRQGLENVRFYPHLVYIPVIGWVLIPFVAMAAMVCGPGEDRGIEDRRSALSLLDAKRRQKTPSNGQPQGVLLPA